MRVGHGFLRGEGFGRDNEEGFGGIQPPQRFGQVGAVDVGYKYHMEGALAVALERLVGHHRTEVGTADANIDDILNGLAGMAFPVAGTNLIGKGLHLLEHGMHLRDDILAINLDHGILWRTQRHVQDGAVFGGVYFFAGEHRFDPRLQVGGFGQAEQKFHRFGRDAVLGIIQ